MKDLYVYSMYKKMYTNHNTKDGKEELEIYSCKFLILYVKVKVTQSCLTLCDAMDCTVQGIAKSQTQLSDSESNGTINMHILVIRFRLSVEPRLE